MLDRMFVYGTLQKGGRFHHLVEPFLRERAEGIVPGVLLGLGEFPGLVEGSGTVYGQVLRLQPIEQALDLLDNVEGYRGPGHPGNLFQRVTVGAVTPDGTVQAWVYRYVGARGAAPTLPGGRWVLR